MHVGGISIRTTKNCMTIQMALNMYYVVSRLEQLKIVRQYKWH